MESQNYLLIALVVFLSIFYFSYKDIKKAQSTNKPFLLKFYHVLTPLMGASFFIDFVTDTAKAQKWDFIYHYKNSLAILVLLLLFAGMDVHHKRKLEGKPTITIASLFRISGALMPAICIFIFVFLFFFPPIPRPLAFIICLSILIKLYREIKHSDFTPHQRGRAIFNMTLLTAYFVLISACVFFWDLGYWEWR